MDIINTKLLCITQYIETYFIFLEYITSEMSF